ncbi:MAG: VIT domain-containing protein [Polyangiaceae bacterium]
MRRSTLSIASLLVVGLGSAVAFSGTRHELPKGDPNEAVAPTSPEANAAPTLAEGVKEPEKGAPSPLSLTASDGTGLKLAAIDARTVLEDPLALTELRLTFENVQERILEGNFKIMLPPGAALSRFAMKVDGEWQEAEMVEKQAARRAYEDFLHRKQDPALLEQAPGNEFAARVFPIPARGKKEIIVTYSQSLDARADYTLLLQGLARLDNLSVRVHTSGIDKPLFELQRKGFLPGSDLVVPVGRFQRLGGLRAGNYVMARVVPIPKGDLAPDPLGASVFLVDTSASRALGLAEQTKVLASLVASLPPGSRVSVLAFDQTTEVVFDGQSTAFGAAEVSKLEARGALGASNMARALTDATAHAKARGDRPRRLVVLTDGVVTAGAHEARELRGKLEGMTDSPFERIDAVVVGGLRDENMLTQLVRGNLKTDGVVVDGKLPLAELKRRLDGSTRSKIDVHVEGATWAYPDQIDGVQPGDEVRIFAEVPEGKAPRIRLGEATPIEPRLREVEKPLLERAWASAKIESLLASPPSGDKEAGKRAIVAVSTKHRVLSPYTSMLVLETDADYNRFGIDRKAKLDVLTIDGTKIAVAHERRGPKDVEKPEEAKTGGTGTRAKGEEGSMGRGSLRDAQEFGIIGLLNSGAGGAPNAPTAPWGREDARDPVSARGNLWGDQTGDAFGAGGLGLSGVGEGGGGRGAAGPSGGLGHGAGTGSGQGFGSGGGRLDRAATTSAPGVRMGTVEVTPGLPSEVMQRIVRQNFGRIRLCYENGLRANPALRGVVAVRFSVDRTGGAVATAEAGSTLPDAGVRSCIERMMTNVTFPAPERSAVAARFQFLLGDGTESVRLPALQTPPGTFLAPRAALAAQAEAGPGVRGEAPYSGPFKAVMDAIADGKKEQALEQAKKWQRSAPADVLSLVALGEAEEAAGNKVGAARAYGSILELFSFRADSRRFAGERLERLGAGVPVARDLARDAFEGAVEQRPDHPASHRLYAYALLREGRYAEAMTAIEKGVKRKYPEGRFAGVDRILREDMALIAAAWVKAQPERRAELDGRLDEQGVRWDTEPSVRFVLVWETDANDVDFHIRDGRGGHAYYSQRDLPSGGSLYADVTTGYGPECFTIRGSAALRAYPYQLSAHYYSRGPMGYGMGKLQIVEHDGHGGLSFEERPFVIMQDHAFVDLGVVKGPLQGGKI